MSMANRLGALWLAVGLVLSTGTKLRLESAPLGPGEILLGIWAAFTPLLIIGRRDRSPRAAWVMLLFWWAAITLLVIGANVAAAKGVVPREGILHDVVAFVYTAGVTLAILFRPGLQDRVRPVLATVLAVTVGSVGFLYLWATFVSPSLGPISLYYGRGLGRFSGLSRNPNQLALLVLPVPFLAAHFLWHARRLAERGWYAAMILVVFLVGVATRSDALWVSWCAGVVLALALAWLRMARQGGGNPLRQAVLLVGIPVGVVGVAAVYGPSAVRAVVAMGAEMYAQGDQGADRLQLWMGGLKAIGSSPLVGLGPGAHAGPNVPFMGREAHNTFIDWSMSAGLLGLGCYLALMGWFARETRQARQPALLVIIGAGVVFSLFHYVMRHPIFWFYIASVAILARNTRAAGTPQPPAAGGPPREPTAQGSASPSTE